MGLPFKNLQRGWQRAAGGGRGAKLDSILPIRQLRSWKWLLSTISFCCLTMANGGPMAGKWQTHPSMTMANFDPWQDFHPLSLDPLGPGQRTAQHAFNATHAQSQQFDAITFVGKPFWQTFELTELAFFSTRQRQFQPPSTTLGQHGTQ